MAGMGLAMMALWATAGAAALAGLAMLYFSLLHDRSRGRRRCPKCWYDLSGNIDSRTCSECGHTATSERMLHRTRRRPWRAGFAFMLIIGSVALVTYGRMDVQSLKPVWLLTYEMHVDGTRGEAARRELITRGRDGRLSIRQQQRLADHVLVIQADMQVVWTRGSYPAARDAEWAPMFEEAWRRGVLREEQVQQYFRNAFELTFQFEHRQSVRAGEPIPIRFSTGRPRLYSWDYLDPRGDRISLRARLMSAEGVDPAKPQLPAMLGGEMRNRPPLRVADIPRDFPLGSSRGAGSMISSLLPAIHTPGPREVTLHLKFGVVAVSGGAPAPPGAEYDLENAIAQWDRTITFIVDVLPPNQSPVALVNDPTLHDVIRGLLQFELHASQVEISGTTYGDSYGIVLVHPTLPVNLGFDVFARSGGREQWLGSIVARANLDRVQNAVRLSRRASELFDEPFVDVILRANPHAAERTIDIAEIWDGEITVENVPVRDGPAN